MPGDVVVMCSGTPPKAPVLQANRLRFGHRHATRSAIASRERRWPLSATESPPGAAPGPRPAVPPAPGFPGGGSGCRAVEAAGLPVTARSTYARILRDNRAFRRLWLADLVSLFGDWFNTIAVYTAVEEL